MVLLKGLRGTAVSPTLPHLELILESEGHGRAAHFRATAKTWVFSGITSMKFNVEMRARIKLSYSGKNL